MALLSHYPPNRSSSPCTSVYWGILNQYTGFKSHHIQTFKADLKQELKTLEDIFLSRGENEKIVLLFNGICSFLLSYEFIDGFRRLLSKYTSSDWRLGVYWHETAWNAKLFSEKYSSNWQYMQELFSEYNDRIFHLVPTSQNKQIVMYLTPTDPSKIRVVFETIPINLVELSERRQGGNQPKVIIGAGIPDMRKGFDRFISLSANRKLSKCDFRWHWKESIEKVRKNFPDIGNIDYRGYVQNFSTYLKENADIFLLTSRDDPSPIVCLEALSVDLPVFAYDSTGYVEVLPPEFIASDSSDMEKKILDYINNGYLNYPKGFFRGIALEYTPDKFLTKLGNSSPFDFLYTDKS